VGKGTDQVLAISWSTVVVKHGGDLSFESAAGRGTSFTIRLPIRPVPVAWQEAGTGG
jgi:signal transduction histidine kinase